MTYPTICQDTMNALKDKFPNECEICGRPKHDNHTHPVSSDQFWLQLKKLIPGLPDDISECIIRLKLGKPVILELTQKLKSGFSDNETVIYELKERK